MTRLEVNLTGSPQPAQEPFFCAKGRHIAYGGARGGGKSWAMRRKFVLLALHYPGLKLMLLRRTLPELRENHILPLLGELSRFCRYSDDQKAFIFPNGSRLKLGYCDAERDVYQYQGQEYDVIGFEEATHFTQPMVEFILTCNRSTRRDLSPRAYYTANPGNVGHAWFKRLFIDRDFTETERPGDYHFFKARIYDNPALLEADPGYLRTLQNLPDDLRRAHLEGDWDVFAGQVFKEFRREIHVCDPFPIPAHWRRWISNDPGYNDLATWYWHAADEAGQVYTYREYTISKDTERREGDATAWMQARRVNELCGDEPIDFIVSGFDVTRQTGSSAMSFSDHYVEAGLQKPIPPQVGNDRSKFSRRMIVHEFLRPYTVPASDTEPARTTAKVQIFSTCRELVRTLPLLVYDEKDTDQIAPSRDDHSYDGWSYGIQAWHARAVAPATPAYQPGTAGDILRHARKLGTEKPRDRVFG
ncbi:MAG TPA: phage terminase large subunit [Tepidisphaeraceae bacterium]|nr:phage terminase large subunit [Tepidisphaeraceae bacterium]